MLRTCVFDGLNFWSDPIDPVLNSKVVGEIYSFRMFWRGVDGFRGRGKGALVCISNPAGRLGGRGIRISQSRHGRYYGDENTDGNSSGNGGAGTAAV